MAEQDWGWWCEVGVLGWREMTDGVNISRYIRGWWTIRALFDAEYAE